MAKTSVLLFFLLSLVAIQSIALGAVLGGRTEVKDVKTNKEIQDLGSYCVDQYNTKLKHSANGGQLVSFSEVVKAEKQVVSGIKYYLMISTTATSGSRVPKIFDAVAVVKPWVHSRELLNFAPSAPAPAPSMM